MTMLSYLVWLGLANQPAEQRPSGWLMFFSLLGIVDEQSKAEQRQNLETYKHNLEIQKLKMELEILSQKQTAALPAPETPKPTLPPIGYCFKNNKVITWNNKKRN